jgi:uncharacterized membrane protein YjgN (DUF898 family)
MHLQREDFNMAWYYKDGDREIGPVNKAQLQQLITAGKIGAQTMIRRADADRWQPLIKLVKGGGRPKKATPPPSPEVTPSGESVPSSQPGPAPTPPPAGQPELSTASHAPAALSQTIPFQFGGKGGEYFKIWIVNTLLSALTLGIYSAWAKVRRKQYFYGNTQVNGASFQYLADPVKILKGRIIVFVGFAIYWLLNQFYPLFGLILVLAFMPAFPWFVVRALTFNARNSALRNIRFNFHGTYLDAAKVFIFWPMLIPFTLGIIAPYLFYRQKKFLVENSAYGTARFGFTAAAKDYYLLVLMIAAPFVLCVIAAIAAGYLFPPATVLAIAAFYLYAMAYFAVKSHNLLYNSSMLSGHGFKARMAIKDYALIVITNTLATVVTLGLFHPFAQVRAYRYKISRLALVPGGNLDQFVAAEQEQVSALGDEMSDFMDFDLGL